MLLFGTILVLLGMIVLPIFSWTAGLAVVIFGTVLVISETYARI